MSGTITTGPILAFVKRLQLDDAVTQRQRDGMSSVHCAKLPHRGLDVLVDRPFVDVENLADLPGRLAVRDPPQDFDFSSRQLAFYYLSSRQKRNSRFRWHFHRVTGWTKLKNTRRQIYC